MDTNDYFQFNPLKLDSATLQMKFANRLQRHNIKSYELVAAELFNDLHKMASSPEFICPFPLIKSPRMINNHAKKIKKTARDEHGLSLGRCQLILAETFGYTHWSALVKAVYAFYGKTESLEIKKRARSIQRESQKQGHTQKLKTIKKQLTAQRLAAIAN